MAQHLVLNSFSLAGPEKFNGVINFFEAMPWYFLLAVEIIAIWIPILFHAVYGIFIVGRAKPNYWTEKYKFSENRMYTFQRYSGIFLFFFLIIHFGTTTAQKYRFHDAGLIKFDAWQHNLSMWGYLPLAFYVLGVLTASYHLCYGIWNFCIRWGITVSPRSQMNVQKFSGLAFVALTVVGWAALAGFMIHRPNSGGYVPADTSSTVNVSYVTPRAS